MDPPSHVEHSPATAGVEGGSVALPRLPMHEARRHPGFLTFYAGLQFLGFGLLLVVGVLIALSRSAMGYGYMSLFPGELIWLSALTLLQLVYAVGLWRMKKWARVMALIFGVINLVFAVIALFIALADGSALDGIGAFIGVTIHGFIVYWFGTHGEYFS
jgi:hypothetical protein